MNWWGEPQEERIKVRQEQAQKLAHIKKQAKKATQELQKLVKGTIYIDEAFFEKIKKLLAQGADPNVQTLVEIPHGSLLDMANPMTEGPLLSRAMQLGEENSAREYGERERVALIRDLIKLLVESGAELNDASYSEPELNYPARWAVKKNDAALVKLMLEKGASPNQGALLKDAVLKGNLKIVQILINAGANLNAQDNSGKTPLMWAIEKNKEDIAHQLIQSGANVHQQALSGYTALDFAVSANLPNTLKEIIDRNGVDTIDHLGESWGWTPLMKAVSDNHYEIAQLLVNAGADLKRTSFNGATALDIAIKRKNQRMIDLLSTTKLP